MKLLFSENRKTAGRPARFVALLTAVLLLASLIPMSGIAPGTAAFADTITGTGYTFDDITGKLTVTSNDGTNGWNAGGFNNGDIKSVVFEHGVTEIYYSAFDRCYGLQSADFTKATDLTTIGAYAFEECKNLQNLDLSRCTKLTSLGMGAFSECESIRSVDLSSCTNLTTIGSAFQYCDDLESIVFPASLRTIGDDAFRACEKLDSVIFPANLQAIGDGAFRDCNLASIDLSRCTKLTTIGSAFEHCGNLDSVVFPASLESIGDDAFRGCILTSIDLSRCPKLTSIGDGAFSGCSSLDNVTFPVILRTIGDGAFQDCEALSVLRFLGTTAPTVGTDAFDGVSAKGALYFSESAKGYSVITPLFPGWALNPSSDAGLASVAGRSIVAGSQAGTKAAPKTASISVENIVAGIGLSDIVTSDTKAAKHIYSDSNFSVNAASISLTAGADTHVYVKVVAEDGTTIHYDVTVARAGTTPDVPGGGDTPGGDSGQTVAKVDSIKASQKTIYIAKGKKAVLPYIVYGSGDAKQAKIKLDWKASNKKVASVKNIKKNKGSIQAGVGKNQKLVIKAGKKLGKSRITLTAPNGKKLAITVKVVKNAKQVAKQSVKIKNLPKGKALARGKSMTLKAAFTKDATAIVIWKSSKPSVIKIDASGKITALKKGKATITLKVGGKTQKAVIRVKN